MKEISNRLTKFIPIKRPTMIYQLPETKKFEKQIAGKSTHLITLKNRSGMQVAFTDYGARIVSILVPDKNGNLTDVVLGFDSIDGYLEAKESYHGATIGRFANRIAQGKFTLDGQSYTLDQNNGPNSLHGGPTGFHNRVWDRQVSFKKIIDFSLVSEDGEEGFPGKLHVHVSYELTEDNEIIIKYKANTDKTTVINFTNHAFFNLNGEGNGDILSHLLQIPATQYLPIDANLIPLGTTAELRETAFDFTSPKKIAQDIGAAEEQISRGNGYDHNYINTAPISQPAATAHSESSGIVMQVFTTEPGLQFYSGNFLNGSDSGKSGNKYLQYSGFCLETQHYPDSPNQAHFPSVRIAPGETFTSQTSYKFSVCK